MFGLHFFQGDWLGFVLYLSSPVLCLAFGVMQSEDQHHQPRLRGTGCAHLTTGRDIHSPGARPIIFVLQSVIPVDFKELHPSLFPSN